MAARVGGGGSSALPHLPTPLQLRGRVIIKSKLKVAKAADAALPPPLTPPLSHSLLSLVYLRGVPWRQLLEPALVGPAATSSLHGTAAPNFLLSPLRSSSSTPPLSVAVTPAPSCCSHMEADARVMASLKDGKLEALLKQQQAGQAGLHSTQPPLAHPPRMDISRITQTHLLRVYPGPLHFDSSNFSPCRFWAQGVQMTALNYQTQDTCLRLQRAWFKQNGRCGYVLKPAYLRLASPTPSPLPLCTSPAPSPLPPLLPTALPQGLARGNSGSFTADTGCDAGAAGAGAMGSGAGEDSTTPRAASPLLMHTPRDLRKSLVTRARAATSTLGSACLLFSPAELDSPPCGTAPQATLCLTLHGAQNLPCGSGASPLHWLQWTVSVHGHPLDEQKVRLRPVARVNDACVWAAGSGGVSGGGGGDAGFFPPDLSGAQGGSSRAASSPAHMLLPLHYPAVACLYIELHGHGDAGAKGSGTFLAYAALPLPSARVGFRGLSMRNAAGKKLPLCTLLCNFQRR